MSDVERDRYDLDEERPIDEEAETPPLAEPPIEVPEADSLDQQREVPLDEDDDRA
jgi:hypothetical protein